MHRSGSLAIISVCVAVILGGCSRSPTGEAVATSTASVPVPSRPSASAVEVKSRPKSWRMERFIPVAEAVERLQAHVDVPVVLPRDRSAGLPNLKGWLADPKYLGWSTVEGVRAGSLKIQKGRQMLIISYGLAGFDGCGDRSHAIETNVLGRPGLVSQAREHLWSHVLWPVTRTGSTGRYGITGTFEGWAMVRFAESMESARLEALDHVKGC